MTFPAKITSSVLAMTIPSLIGEDTQFPEPAGTSAQGTYEDTKSKSNSFETITGDVALSIYNALFMPVPMVAP